MDRMLCCLMLVGTCPGLRSHSCRYSDPPCPERAKQRLGEVDRAAQRRLQGLGKKVLITMWLQNATNTQTYGPWVYIGGRNRYGGRLGSPVRQKSTG